MNLIISTLVKNEKKLAIAVAIFMAIGVTFTILQSGVIANLLSFTFNLEGMKDPTTQAEQATTLTNHVIKNIEQATTTEKNIPQLIWHTLLLIKNEGNLEATRFVVESHNLGLMLSLGGMVFFFIAITQFLFFSKDFLIHLLSLRLMAHLRRNLFGKFMTLPSESFKQQESGDLISRTLVDVERVGLQLREFLEGVVYGLVLSIAGFVVMFYLNTQLTLILLVVAVILVVLIQFSGGLLRRIVQSLQQRISNISQRLQEAIYAIDIVKIYTRERWETHRFDRQVKSYLHLAGKEALIFQLIRPITEVIGILGIIVVFLYAASLIWKSMMKLEDLMNFLIVLMYVIPYLQRLTRAFFIREQIEVSAARINFLLQLPGEDVHEKLHIKTPVLKNPNKAIENALTQKSKKAIPTEKRYKGKAFSGALQAKKVSFYFNAFPLPTEKNTLKNNRKVHANNNPSRKNIPKKAKQNILTNISFDVKAGEMIALVGPSGSGKTTLISLIAMLQNPSSGTLYYDGTAHNKLSLFEIRSQISLVSQENILLSGSLMENIRYGKMDASDTQVIAAAEKAHLNGVIKKLDGGLHGQIGERGTKLSGGEKQRVAIARAIIKQPKILLLDEATSALDSQSERVVQATIEEVAKNRTTFVVAHRLSTVLKADKIFVFDKGRIIESGTHAQLLKNGKLYKNLYELQFH